LGKNISVSTVKVSEGWLDGDDEHDSLSSFDQRKMNMKDKDDFKGLWERVISPTIQQKYVTVRCNLNNEVQKAYKSK